MTRSSCVWAAMWVAGAMSAACSPSPASGGGGVTLPDNGLTAADAGSTADSVADTTGSSDAASSETLGGGDAIADAKTDDAATTSDAASDAGSADAGPAPGYNGAPVPLADLAAAVATEMCKANATICTPQTKLPYATLAGCTAGLKSADAKDFAELAAMVAAGKMTYDPAKAGECLALCTATCLPLDFVDGPPACQAVFKGTFKDGESCVFNVSCASNYCADNSDCPGKCKARIAAGGKCGDADKCVAGHVCFGGKCVPDVPKDVGTGCGSLKCKAGAFCNKDSKCEALHELGQKCPDLNTCKLGLQCIDAGSGGVCVPMPKAGEPCYVDVLSDASTQCAKGLVCFHDGEADTGVCQAKVEIGQPCENTSQCGGWDIHCIGAVGQKTCQPVSGQGGPCETAKIEFGELAGCLDPFTCAKGVCIPPPGLGQACADDFLKQCADGLYCDMLKNVCIPIPGDGEACYGLCKDGFDCDQPVDTKPGVCKSACP